MEPPAATAVAVASENSVRRPRKPRVFQDEVDPDDSFDDEHDDPSPRPKRRRATAGVAASRLLGERYSLMDVIKYNGKLIPLAVKLWVERYEKDGKSAMAELLMSLFEACGTRYQLDANSIDEIDVDSVVLDLVNLARKGEVEDYYSSKQKDLKHFKENLAILWESLVLECQNGPLFDKVLFEKCSDYVIALSCTPPRVYRQVASMVGLQLVSSTITVAKTLGGQRETTQRQLNAEMKKRNDGPRVESLNKRLSLSHEKITSAEEMMRKIFTGLFMHRYRDVDPDIRMSCIKALGVWITSYPSFFLKDSYLKYLGWTLNDKSPAVRKTSIWALQNLYEGEENVPSLGLFTERFSNRMIELADDIDVSVAVSAIGLLKQLLRHQLLTDDELGPLYDLLIDEPPMIRRAIGELVYDHLIAQNTGSLRSDTKGDDVSPEVHLGRMLQILREFPNDPILSSYVIDDVWDDMNAMKDWKCIISMLLDENPSIELTDVDATNLIRLLYASAKKAVGEKIVPATDNRKHYYNKAQKELFDNNRRDLTTAMLKSYPLLLRRYAADRAKISPLVELATLLKLELYSLKRQEQSFRDIVELISDSFFKHNEKDALRSCLKAINFCFTDSQADLQDFAYNKLKELEDELLFKLKSAMKDVAMGNDEYSLLVNLKRFYELQLVKHVANDSIYENMVSLLKGLKDLDTEVLSFLLLNMYLHVLWCLLSLHSDNPNEAFVAALMFKRNTLFEQLEQILNSLQAYQEGKKGTALASRVCIILAEMWCMFKKTSNSTSKLESLGYVPNISTMQKFWRLCELQLSKSDETEDEDANEDYIEDTNRNAVLIAAIKLVTSEAVPKVYLGPEIISHFVMHGPSVAELIKHLITFIKKNADDDIPSVFLESLKRAYQWHMGNEEFVPNKLSDCKELASRLSGTFSGTARNKHRPQILQIVRDGISFAFLNAPKQLTFLEYAVLPFVSKLPASDALEILKDVQKRAENVNTNEDPSGWRPYHTFVDRLREKCTKNDDDKEANPGRRRGRPRKDRNIEGRKLFDEHGSTGEDSISESERTGGDEAEEQQPLIHTFRSSASKLRAMKVPHPETERAGMRVPHPGGSTS